VDLHVRLVVVGLETSSSNPPESMSAPAPPTIVSLPSLPLRMSLPPPLPLTSSMLPGRSEKVTSTSPSEFSGTPFRPAAMAASMAAEED